MRAVQNEIISRLGRDMSAVLTERFYSLTAMLDRFVTELIAWHGDNRNLLMQCVRGRRHPGLDWFSKTVRA